MSTATLTAHVRQSGALPRVNGEWTEADTPACRTYRVEHDRDPWFDPDEDESYDERAARVAEAKDVCGRCPLQAACLVHALAHGESVGVWGGMDERERYRLARRSCGTPQRALRGCCHVHADRPGNYQGRHTADATSWRTCTYRCAKCQQALDRHYARGHWNKRP